MSKSLIDSLDNKIKSDTVSFETSRTRLTTSTSSFHSSRLSLKESSTNPFKLPTGEQWLGARRNFSLKLAYQRADERAQPKIFNKHTFKTRHTGGALPRIRKILKDYDSEAVEEIKNDSSNVIQAFEIAKRQSTYRTKPIQREFVSDIIANKRQLFLAEYVLQTKRETLNKLQEQVQAAEKELYKAEKKLEIDAMLFDDFLKATDKSAVDAMQECERVSEIRSKLSDKSKRLNLKKSLLQSELSRFDETLFKYLDMKRFVWKVFRDTTNNKDADEVITLVNKMICLDESADPNQDSERLVDTTIIDDTTQNVPFQCISAIPEIITELEDNNLQMIHHFQHSEELVEEMKSREYKKKTKLTNQVKDLKTLTTQLEQTISAREKRAKELKFVCNMYEVGSWEQEAQENTLLDLCGRIEKVYKIVVGQLEIKIDGLMMLTSIENRLEDLIEEIDSFPSEKVKLAQKFKDKQRRLKMREEKLQEQKNKQEERAKRAQERAQAMTFRAKGRKLVVRSDPVKNGKNMGDESVKVKNEVVDDDSEFFSW